MTLIQWGLSVSTLLSLALHALFWAVVIRQKRDIASLRDELRLTRQAVVSIGGQR